jgi:hypothetical protein
MLHVMLGFGIGVTAGTVAILVAGYFLKRRRRSFPIHGWIGLLALAAAEALLFRGLAPLATFFTPIVCPAYILITDAAVPPITPKPSAK